MYRATTLRRDDLGRIQAGATADLVSIQIQALGRSLGGGHPENALLYANSGDVQLVMTHGDIYIHNGEVVIADAAKVVRRASNVKTLPTGRTRAVPSEVEQPNNGIKALCVRIV